MTPTDYLQAFKAITDSMRELTAKKNQDYAGAADAFSNFRVVETIGLCSVEVGILTRMSDKLARAARLLSAEARVDESIEDTLMDLAVYSIILMIYLRQKVDTSRLKFDYKDTPDGGMTVDVTLADAAARLAR